MKQEERITRAICLLFSAISLLFPRALLAAPSDGSRAERYGRIENVTRTSAVRYGAPDNYGHTLDCIKVIDNPYVPGQFIGAWHTMAADSKISVNLGISTDLMTWTWKIELASGDAENGSAMSAINGHQPSTMDHYRAVISQRSCGAVNFGRGNLGLESTDSRRDELMTDVKRSFNPWLPHAGGCRLLLNKR